MPDLSFLLKPLSNFLSVLQSERHYKNSKREAALIAIRTAPLETKKYIEISNGVINRSQEFELSKLWSEASIKIHHASRNLSTRLNKKSNYWSDKIKWPRGAVIENKIDFESIERDIDKLLKS